MRRAGRRLRLSAQLVSTKDGYHIWSEEYDRELADVFAVQDELARAIVGALRVTLQRPAGAALVKAGTADLEAHDLYLQGRFQWNRRTYESMLEAVRYFKRAIARDSTYAEAYAGLAETYVLFPTYAVSSAVEAFPQARSAALRALTLDSTLGNAHATLGVVREQYEYDWAGAERELRRAIALDPGYATAHQWYAEYLSATGRDAEARLEAERAVALDPLSAVIRVDQALALARGRHLEEAIGVLQRVLETNPDFMAAHNTLGWVYCGGGTFRGRDRRAGGHGADEPGPERHGAAGVRLRPARADRHRAGAHSIADRALPPRVDLAVQHCRGLHRHGRPRAGPLLVGAGGGRTRPECRPVSADRSGLRLAPAGSPIPAAAASGGIGVKPRMSSDLATRLQAALGDAYRIERELGGGGMSRLFVAEEASLHRRVVVKVLPPQFASEVSAARFRQEVEVAARLQHPNILPVLAAGTRDDLIYYIIPYVPGESLRHRLTREGRLPVPDALEILREVADALAYAHSEGILHRDIKPENVLLMGRHASLTDFGVARALSEARTGEPLTETGLAVGTPGYMAPEQAAGERHLDARADVYALAVVGYEMLTGKPPFEGPTAQAVLAAHLTITPRPLSEIRPEVPAGVSEVIARALHKSPVDRLRTAAELRDGLRVEMAVSTPPWRGLWWAAGVIALALIAGGLALFGRSRSPSRVDENLLAVAPFDAVSPSVEEYREGLLTILSRSLDGAGPIRTVSPTIVVRRWAGESDPASASALGRGTGAGLVVFGQVVPAGADSVRLSATIYDVRRERSAAEVEVRDDRQRIDRIADTLAVRLLREVGRTRPVGAVRFAALGSTSLPAIKLFLAAEQFYRRGQWDSTQ